MPMKPHQYAPPHLGAQASRRRYARTGRSGPAHADAVRVHGSGRWKAVSRRHKRHEPLCRACKAQGITRAAQQVDHVVPIHVAPGLAFVRSNLQSLCTSCHAAKSAVEAKDRRAASAPPGTGGGRVI